MYKVLTSLLMVAVFSLGSTYALAELTEDQAATLADATTDAERYEAALDLIAADPENAALQADVEAALSGTVANFNLAAFRSTVTVVKNQIANAAPRGQGQSITGLATALAAGAATEGSGGGGGSSQELNAG